MRRLRAAGVRVAAMLAAVALSGCGGGAGAEQVAGAELPVGDPGQSAPEVPEPNGPPEEHEDGPALTVVPAQALLDAPTVGGVVGGAWRPAGPAEAVAAGPCGPLPGDAAARSVRLTDGTRELLQTVLSYRHGEDTAAVPVLVQSLARCGWQQVAAPPLGEHSAQAAGDEGRALVVSAEGAVVLLVGTGGLADDPVAWDSLADVALGSACPAAPGGCH